MIHRTLPSIPSLLAVLLAVLLAPALAQEGSSEGDVQTQLQDARRYLAAGDCELAQYFYQEALDLEPRNVEALVGKGRALSCRNAFDLAAEQFRAAIEVDPSATSAYVQLALTYQRQYASDPEAYANRLNDALAVIRDAPAGDASVHNTEGLLLFRLERFAEARDALTRAATLADDPGSALSSRERSTIRINLGSAQRALGEIDAARESFRRAVVLDPANAEAHLNLGDALFLLEDCDGAEFELSQALALADEALRFEALANLGITRFECGRPDEALPLLEQAVAQDAAIFLPPLYTYLGRAYSLAGRHDAAVQRANQGALLPPPTADGYYWLGQVYEARGGSGDAERAREAYEDALEIDPEFTPAQEALEALGG